MTRLLLLLGFVFLLAPSYAQQSDQELIRKHFEEMEQLMRQLLSFDSDMIRMPDSTSSGLYFQGDNGIFTFPDSLFQGFRFREFPEGLDKMFSDDFFRMMPDSGYLRDFQELLEKQLRSLPQERAPGEERKRYRL